MYKYASFSLIVIFILAACSQNPIDIQDSAKPVVTLRATLMEEPDTKTEIGLTTSTESYFQVVWTANDSLKVFHSSGSSQYVAKAGGEVTAEFTLVPGESTPEGTSFLGLSPYSADAAADLSAEIITTSIPARQVAISGTFDPSARLAVGSSSTADKMALYNVCSAFRFTLSESQISNYASIELKGNDNEKIAGPVTISGVGTEPIAKDATGSTTSVSLTIPSGESFQKGVYYYIILRPCVFQNGFTLTFKDANGTDIYSRKCSSYVEFKRGRFATVRDADSPNRLPAIRDGKLLSEKGTANCYIVDAAGAYKFPLTRGGEKELLSDITKVSVIWETDNTAENQKSGSIITDVVKNANYIFFNTPAKIKNGNALIAAYRGEEIVWSWHIWVCEGYDPSATKQQYTGKKAAMMDRNLGALSTSESNALSNGLFYQWGRKDPFPGAAESYASGPNDGQFMAFTSKMKTVPSETVTGTVEYATQNPLTFITTEKVNGNWLAVPDHGLWAQNKTIYDPCPSGWKVPAAYVLNSSRQHITEEEAWSGLNFYRVAGPYYGVYLDGNKVWYPNNGYISTSGTLLMVGQFSCYWSCSPNSQAVYAMEMSKTPNSLTFDPMCYGKVRAEGHSVRCVEDK